MNLKKHSNCLSQAIPPIKSWLHGNTLNYLALAVSVFSIASPQIHAATENNLNQTFNLLKAIKLLTKALSSMKTAILYRV